MSCELCQRPLPAEAPAMLCPGCTRATGERLAALPGLYVTLGAFRALAQSGSGGSGCKPVDAPLPLSEPVLSLRGPGGIVAVLEDWRSALHADLGWSQPVPRGSYEQRVKTAAAGLRDNVLWIASSWPAAGTFAQELRDLERAITSIVDPVDSADRPRRLGYCPAPTVGGPCGAVVSLPAGTALAACRWCRAEYPPESWLALAGAQSELEEAS